MIKSPFEFEVLVNGSPVKEYYHEGRTYIEGKEGTRFSLRMRNNSNKRVLFVPTIDGLSIIDGKSASYESRGYLVSAYGSVKMDGWRRSNDDVAEFYFSSPGKSYSVKSKKGASNLGVIGAAVFKEKEYLPTITYTYMPSSTVIIPMHPTEKWNTFYCSSGQEHMYTLSASGSSTTTSSINSVNQALGTGWGDIKKSSTEEVSFERASSTPDTVFAIYYNGRQELEAMGIQFHQVVYVSPSPFPKEGGFCEPPKE